MWYYNGCQLQCKLVRYTGRTKTSSKEQCRRTTRVYCVIALQYLRRVYITATDLSTAPHTEWTSISAIIAY